ncbi:hypothetical protein FJZ33_06015 [Candidatus Poribacteria bacterium]|nr:hypothetical protein [Candidatus Poribacteria bacterium]
MNSAISEQEFCQSIRADGKKGRSSAVLTFGPFGGFHGHFDKLSFVYFGMGKELGYDPGRALSQAYRLPIHRDWYRATTSHNTVLVDRKSQEGVEGTCELFINTPEISACGASTDKAYAGIMHRRLLILRPDFLVVIDLLNAYNGKDHIFDWMYHNLGDRIHSESAYKDDQALEGQGFEYIKDLRTGDTDTPINAVIDMGRDQVQVLLDEVPGSQVIIGTGVGESIMHRVPLIFVTRKGQKAHFAAVIEPIPEGQNGIVKSIKLIKNEDESYIIRIQMNDGGKESYLYDPHKSILKME